MDLSQYLELKGLTDADVARETGLNRTTISRLRRGEINSTMEVVARISNWSGGAVTADDLHAAYVAARPVPTPSPEQFQPEPAE